MEYWNGVLEWSTGMECWTGVLEWSAGLEYWTGVLEWSTGMECWSAHLPIFFHPELTYTDGPSSLLHSSTCCSHPHSDSVDGVVSHSYGGLGRVSSD